MPPDKLLAMPLSLKTEILSLGIILHKRRILIITFLSVFLFLSSSFIPQFVPSLISREIKLLYFFSIPVILLIILLLGLISIIRIVIAKRRDNLPNKVSIVGFSLLVSFIILTPLTFAVHRYAGRALPAGSDTKSFDSGIWKSESSTDWNEGISLREQMLQEVVEKILPGKSKQEIEKALGPSLETFYFSNLDKDLIYYLGPERDGLFNIDSEWLLIWMDEDGNFKRYKIAND